MKRKKEKLVIDFNSDEHRQVRDLVLYFQYGIRANASTGSLLKGVTGPVLRREGFKEVNRSTFIKSFSGIMELRITLGEGAMQPYQWWMSLRNLDKMTEDLRDLKAALELRAATVYTLSYGRHSISEAGKRYWNRIRENLPQTRILLDRFRSKYGNFLDLMGLGRPRRPYHTRQAFFFDACESKTQLKHYFDFIELFVDVFVGFRNHRRHLRKVSEPMIGISMLVYHSARMRIVEIRKLHRMGWSLKELSRKFDETPPHLMEHYVERNPETGRYKNMPSELALREAAQFARLTPKSLRKQFKKRKDLFARTEKHLLSSAGSFEGAPSNLVDINTENIPKEDWITWIRLTLVSEATRDSLFAED